ncbi:MAG TPA: tetratricopeptide repeat protein [Pyrinomonadaceae bacterium]|jgi:tetratricopeptide (TPR) repeat protein
MKNLRRPSSFVVILLCLAAVPPARAQGGGQVWRVTRFDVTATLPAANATERVLTARANITARNVSQSEYRTFTVRLNPAAEITAVTVGDQTATYNKREDQRTKTQTVQINLPGPFQPNATVAITVDYRLPLAGQNTGLAALSPEGAQFLPLSFWYPAPNSPFALYGADFAPVRLTVNAPGGPTVVSSGQTAATVAGQLPAAVTFEQKLNAQPFFLAGKWEAVEGAGDARGVSAFLPAGAGADERRQAEALISTAAAARAFFAALLGPAPDAPVRLVAVRRGAGFDSGGTVLLDAAAFRRAKVDATSALAVGEAVARLWLGGAASVRGEGSGVVHEGLVRYLATLFLEKQYGRDAAEAQRLRERIAYASIAGRDGPLAQTTPLDPTYFNAVANKGAMVWRLVERAVTRDALVGVVRAQAQGGELTLASLRAALAQLGGAQVKALLDVQFDQPTQTDLLVGLPQQRGGEWVAALRNTGPQPLTVTVAATTDAGQQLTTVAALPAQDFGEAHFKTAARVVRVEVDPEKLNPQTDYDNDVAPRAPGLTAALEETRRASGAGDYAKAEQLARAMLQAAPLMQEARVELARALLAAGRVPDAEREFRAALDDRLPLPATLAWGAYGLAEIAQRKGQTADALRLYTDAVRAEGGSAPTLAARGARLRLESAAAPAVDEAIKQYLTQLDQAIRGGRKADLDPLVVPGELTDFTKGFIVLQPEVWQTRALHADALGGDRVAADVTITAKTDGRDRTITAVYVLARAGGSWRLAEIPLFEER